MGSKNEVVFVEPSSSPQFNLKGIEIQQFLERDACNNFSAYLVEMEPRQTKKASFHKNGEELYYVLSGSGQAKLGENKYSLQTGCFFRVPPGTIHEFTTEEDSLRLLNFHSPPVFADHDTYFVE
ncbi:MAG: cupin domain-containing protein [Nitrospinota bacterium]